MASQISPYDIDTLYDINKQIQKLTTHKKKLELELKKLNHNKN